MHDAAILGKYDGVLTCVYTQVPARKRIDLVCLLGKNSTVHPILSAVLMEGGCQAIDQLASNVSVYMYAQEQLYFISLYPTAKWQQCGEPFKHKL